MLRQVLVTLMTIMLFGCQVSNSRNLNDINDNGVHSRKLYTEGQNLLKVHNYKRAIDTYETFISQYYDSSQVNQAKLNLIYACYKQGDYASAILYSQKYIKLNAQSSNIDYVYYMMALSKLNINKSWLSSYLTVVSEPSDLSQLQEAFTIFQYIVKEFPQSKYAADSYQRAVYLKNVLAKHTLTIATFYYQKQAYVAAANRCNKIIKYYSDTRYSIEALKLLSNIYKKLKVKDMQDIVKNILLINGIK